MEKIYQLKGGGSIKAASAQEAAEKLRSMSFNPCETLEDFIEETAKACYVQSSAEIRTSNVEDFVEDLIANRFMRERK
jgi:hypothetical protein